MLRRPPRRRSQPARKNNAPAARAESRRGILCEGLGSQAAEPLIPRPEYLGDTSRVPWPEGGKYQKPRRGYRRVGLAVSGGIAAKLREWDSGDRGGFASRLNHYRGRTRRPYFAHSSAAVRRPEARARRSRIIRTSLLTRFSPDISADRLRHTGAHNTMSVGRGTLARPIKLQQARACAAFERASSPKPSSSKRSPKNTIRGLVPLFRSLPPSISASAASSAIRPRSGLLPLGACGPLCFSCYFSASRNASILRRVSRSCPGMRPPHGSAVGPRVFSKCHKRVSRRVRGLPRVAGSLLLHESLTRSLARIRGVAASPATCDEQTGQIDTDPTRKCTEQIVARKGGGALTSSFRTE